MAAVEDGGGLELDVDGGERHTDRIGEREAAGAGWLSQNYTAAPATGALRGM